MLGRTQEENLQACLLAPRIKVTARDQSLFHKKGSRAHHDPREAPNPCVCGGGMGKVLVVDSEETKRERKGALCTEGKRQGLLRQTEHRGRRTVKNMERTGGGGGRCL